MDNFFDIVQTRRNLPHWKIGSAIYWVNFRLADSLPQDKLDAWQKESEEWQSIHPQPWDDATWEEYNERFGTRLEKWLDAGMGSCALADPDNRAEVQRSLLHDDGREMTLHAAVIMPTHVHCLLEPFDGFQLSKLLAAIKSVSAHRINKRLGKRGTFWQEESYDHIVRSEAQYAHFMRYIQENPITARLDTGMYWLYIK